MILKVDFEKNLGSDKGRSYDVIVERNALKKIGKYIDLRRKVLVITDRGVPIEYANAVCNACYHPIRVTVEPGEESKSLQNFESLLNIMLENGFTRTDCVVAVGGGVVGDLAGFVAASYMRGIDFYNIPTTILSQVDSSIGGKVAVDLCGVKNIVGAFYQPKRVLIDPDVLKTLPARQISNGISEAIKMSLTSDAVLFEMFESGAADEEIETVIERSLRIKKAVVEQDERENGLRKILNFGHTLGHGIEAEEELHGLYHGECVALGMLPMCSEQVYSRLVPVLKHWNLPTRITGDLEKMLEIAAHDKKCKGSSISVVWVEEVGAFKLMDMPLDEWKKMVRRRLAALTD